MFLTMTSPETRFLRNLLFYKRLLGNQACYREPYVGLADLTAWCLAVTLSDTVLSGYAAKIQEPITSSSITSHTVTIFSVTELVLNCLRFYNWLLPILEELRNYARVLPDWLGRILRYLKNSSLCDSL